MQVVFKINDRCEIFVLIKYDSLGFSFFKILTKTQN